MLDPKDGPRATLVVNGCTVDLGDGIPEIMVETPWMDFEVRKEISPTGKELWAVVTTAPAFTIGLLNPLTQSIVLVRKQRKAGGPCVIKTPGGYYQGNPETAIPRKLLQDTGIEIRMEDLKPFGTVIGHAVIQTPILLYWTTTWSQIQEPRRGIEIFHERLLDACRMASQGKVEDDGSFCLLMHLFYHHHAILPLF